MNKIKIGLIGCGRIAQEHLKAFANIDNVIIQAMADNVPDKVRSTAEPYKCSTYTDYRNMIKSENLNAVVICTPPNKHCEMSAFAMSHGLHVFCEKPLALNVIEAGQMCHCAQKNKAILMMASKFRFVDDVVKAKAIIEAGLLGRIVLFENVFCSKVDMTKRWNSKKDISGGGVLIDNGAHSVDIARFFLGPITLIQAQFGCQIQEMKVEDTARIYFQTKSNVMGMIDLSWSLNKESPNYISIYGTEGTLLIGWKLSQYKLHEKDKWEVFGTGYDKQKAFGNQARHFIECIVFGKKPLIKNVDELAAVKAIETAYKSSKINKWLRVGKL